MKIQLSKSDEQKLFDKMTLEYWKSERHTQNWKESCKDIAKNYLLPKAKSQDKIKKKLVYNNLTIRLAIFVQDELNITHINSWWRNDSFIGKNADKVAKFDFKTMQFRNKYRSALIDDGLYWVWVLAVDGWNDYKQQPILSYIDSRLTFPDPHNWQDNNLRWFWTKVQKSLYELELDDAYDYDRIQQVKLVKDADTKEIERANNRVKGFDEVETWEDLVDLYNHLTIFKAEWDEKHSLYLTTWSADRSILVRAIKMRALTDWEIADPTSIDFWVKFFRANPIKWSYAWASIIDETWEEQDIATLLTNLLIEQAKEAWVWGKTYVNTNLWVDLDDLANNTWPWDIIPFTSNDINLNANNGIFQEPTRPLNPVIQQALNTILVQWDENSATSSLVRWQSIPWWQTKAEVQTIQQNINQRLSYMASNYMDSIKGIWESIYRSYATYMSSQRKKEIVLVDTNWTADSYWFKKNEFIDTKWEIFINITSKAQEDLRKQKQFAQLLSIYQTIRNTLQPWSYGANSLDRLFIDLAWVDWLESETIIPLNADERKAYSNLELLNRNIELKSKPKAWEDHNIYVNIYKKGLQTEARDKAIKQREDLLKIEWEKQLSWEQTWWGGLWASMIASQFSQQQAGWTPSIQDVWNTF